MSRRACAALAIAAIALFALPTAAFALPPIKIAVEAPTE